MVSLKCGIVGVDRSVFSVNIDTDTSVDDLKALIKQKNSAAVTCDAKDLSLFIAKKDGVWLTEREFKRDEVDTSGMTQVGDSEPNLASLPDDADLQIELTEQELVAGKGPVHLLVRALDCSEREVAAATTALSTQQTKVVVGDKRQRTAPEPPTVLDDLYSLTNFVQLWGSKNYLVVDSVLKLPTVVCGKDFSNNLYIRSEYLELHEIIKGKMKSERSLRRVLVVGSPGIGMSEFGIYLLLVFAMEKKDMAYRPLGRMSPYYLTWNSTKGYYNISETPQPGKKYGGLFEGNEAGGALDTEHLLHTFVLSSLHTENYQNFVKESCFTVYMNPWTKDECQSFVDGIGLNEDEWFHRFNLIGGKPRLLFSADEEFDDLVQRMKAAIPETIDGLKEQVRLFQSQVFDGRMKHILFHIYRDDYEPSRGILSTVSFTLDIMIGERYNLPSGETSSLLETLAQNL